MLNRRARSGELVDTILLFFLILCLGFMYWFMIGFTNHDQPIESPSANESISDVKEVSDNLGLEDAIQDLMKDGCKIIIVEPRIYLNNTRQVSFEEFKSKAYETKLVILTPSDFGNILLVQIKKDQWVWKPA